MDEKIVVLTMGGTIDKHYFDALSEYQVAEPVARRILEIARVVAPFEIIEIARKDSLELSDTDRDRLLCAAKSSSASRIVVTHGTDTLATTAATLQAVLNKTIVCVGAFTPARFSKSDAAFNLGMAFATAQIAPFGVYVTINGRIFTADDVIKDRKHSRFVRREVSTSCAKSTALRS